MNTEELYAKCETLCEDEMHDFVEAYAERIVDEMDTKCLMRFVYDTIVENLTIKEPKEILDEVFYVYDEEIVTELIESVTA